MKYWEIVRAFEERLEREGWCQQDWSIGICACPCPCGHMKVHFVKHGHSTILEVKAPLPEMAAELGAAVERIAGEFEMTRAPAERH